MYANKFITKEVFEDTQYVAKSIATCKKNPYIINQNHIFSKNYCEAISAPNSG
jgi:hypothetical protein